MRAKTGGKGIRTPGLLIANETLYQLSYTPVTGERKLACPVDFSPSDSAQDLSGAEFSRRTRLVLVIRTTRKNDCRERFRV
jgi:hypothetical protein